MVELTLDELIQGREILDPEDGIITKGYACYPTADSFFLTDAKPGEKYTHLINCQLSDTLTSEIVNQILTFSKLYHDSCAKELVKPVEIYGSSFRPENAGSKRLFPQIQKVTNIITLE